MITTDRLLLRRWQDRDREPFAALNADPEVMRHFPSVLSSEASDEFVDTIEAGFVREGFGLWAVEIIDSGRFIGFVGLSRVSFDIHFVTAVEIGWRLARFAWGQGYAVEAARAALRYAFGEADLAEVVSFTATTNVRSQALMRRLGMARDVAGDFDHPKLPVGHRLRRHVLYRLRRDEWARGPVGDA